MAAAVVAGEQLLLQQLKKEALMIMLGAGQVRSLGHTPSHFHCVCYTCATAVVSHTWPTLTDSMTLCMLSTPWVCGQGLM